MGLKPRSRWDMALQVREHVRKLPIDEDPQVFGLHPNAQITAQTEAHGHGIQPICIRIYHDIPSLHDLYWSVLHFRSLLSLYFIIYFTLLLNNYYRYCSYSSLSSQAARQFLGIILSVQPRLVSGGQVRPEDLVARLAEQLSGRVPHAMSRREAHPETYKRTPEGGIISLGVFHGQEMDRFNVLIQCVREVQLSFFEPFL